MKTKLNVQGMGCQKCENKVKTAVSSIVGVANVVVDLVGKTVAVEHNPELAPLDRIKDVIVKQGYEILK
jgi:copper chaperone